MISVYCHEHGRLLAKAKPTLEDLRRPLEDERMAKYFADLGPGEAYGEPEGRELLQEQEIEVRRWRCFRKDTQSRGNPKLGCGQLRNDLSIYLRE